MVSLELKHGMTVHSEQTCYNNGTGGEVVGLREMIE